MVGIGEYFKERKMETIGITLALISLLISCRTPFVLPLDMKPIRP
ncbi:MAG: hypothetical protein QT00_C0002G0459 [archaeon GW2011_AR5]|nr:MAG: hypothetical protein QT00_C0002G0459 [archaeon GW2011_AR5]